MSELMPVNEREFLNVNGVGHIKLEKYGAEFMEIISEYVDSL